jgi:hypothetical protein
VAGTTLALNWSAGIPDSASALADSRDSARSIFGASSPQIA